MSDAELIPPEEMARLRAEYPAFDAMIRGGYPLTRETYVRMNWAGEAQEPLDAESEASLPAPFRPFVFFGSLMDGPDLDILEAAGLVLTAAEEKTLWRKTEPRRLLLECSCVMEYPEGVATDTPGFSDKTFRYEATTRLDLIRELRRAIAPVLARA